MNSVLTIVEMPSQAALKEALALMSVSVEADFTVVFSVGNGDGGKINDPQLCRAERLNQ